MSRSLLTFTFLLAALFSTATLPAAELSLSLGIRQTFPVGDTNGDLVIDFDDFVVWEQHEAEFGSLIPGDVNQDLFVNEDDLALIDDGQGASTSGVIGSDGGISGPVATTGNQTLAADGTWQQFTFTLPLNLFSPASDWGVLESIRFANTADGETKYKVWIDDIASTNSGGATVFGDFESNLIGDEVIFQEPSVAGGGDLLGIPDISEVTNSMAFGGSQSLTTEFEFVDDSLSRGAILSTGGADNTPNPLIQLREGDYSQVATLGNLAFSPTTITFWAKATVVPEPSTLLLASLAGLLFGSRRRRA